jgi:hypothetical protein
MQAASCSIVRNIQGRRDIKNPVFGIHIVVAIVKGEPPCAGFSRAIPYNNASVKA